MAESLSTESRLPALREDLQILEGARETDGSKSWLIFDPLRHKYFQIDQKNLALLQNWSVETVGELLELIETEKTTIEDIEALIRFLFSNNLTLNPPQDDVKTFVKQAEAQTRSFLTSILHNYLFIRITLLRPHAFLKKTVSFTDIFFTLQWNAFVVFVGVMGIYLASRQWDQFIHTFLHFFTLKGLIFYGFTLVLIKIAHELGHAYAATRYGCRVPAMGVAFLVMFPVLFTDTTDSWKLRSRKKRLVITAAGVAVELTVAAFATCLWVFLPDGPWRSAAFFIATTSWVMSLAVNLNPLMRFDGYHFLSDLVGVQNLQARSFALGRWKLREILFGFGESAPELMSHIRRRFLTVYAWTTWVYRLFLFTGIAILIHHFFFKPLGAVLFVVEIGFFIALPVINELKEWSKRVGNEMNISRLWRPVSCLFLLLVVFATPWSTNVKIPAILEAAQQQPLFAHRAGIIKDTHVESGQHVKKGEVLFTLNAPTLDFNIQQTQRRIDLAVARLNRVAVDAEDRGLRIELQKELNRHRKALEGLKAEKDLLLIKSPFDGIATDIPASLHDGRWINDQERLVTVRSIEGAQIRGFVSADDVHRLDVGTPAVFIPDAHERKKIDTTISSLNPTAADVLTTAALISHFGGPIAVSEKKNGQTPIKAWYGVSATEQTMASPQSLIRGQLHAKAEPEILMVKIWRRVIHVIIRESTI